MLFTSRSSISHQLPIKWSKLNRFVPLTRNNNVKRLTPTLIFPGMGESTTPAMIRFDPQMVACMWNDHVAPGYNIFLVVIAIFIPILATVFFYISILLYV